MASEASKGMAAAAAEASSAAANEARVASNASGSSDAKDALKRPVDPYGAYLKQGDGVNPNSDYLPWHDDVEMMSRHDEIYGIRAAELDNYYRRHPELNAMLQDFMLFVLQQKPENIIQFAEDFFSTFDMEPSAKGADTEEATEGKGKETANTDRKEREEDKEEVAEEEEEQ